MSDVKPVSLAALPTMADLYARPRACPKGASRLDETKAQDKADQKAEAAFLKDVRKRDQMTCRCCGREVKVVLPRVPERAEVHHLHGRLGRFRFDAKFAILLCCECHERVTGRVNDRLFIVQSARHMATMDGKSLIDGRKPLRFQEAK